MKRVILPLALLATMGTVTVSASEQFAMSDADRAMYKEMLENNPADMYVEEGGELLESELGGEAALAKFLEVSEKELPKYIAGFPRYIKKLDNVVSVDQVMQAMFVEQGKEKLKLEDKKMLSMLAYVKSLANDEQLNMDIDADEHIKASYALGKVVYETPRGGRGLSCNSCHSADIIGQVLRTQPLPDLGTEGAGATWPAYRMTKSNLTTLQGRFQGCMQNALLAVIPLGSKEMNALEVYINKMAQDSKQPIAIPGLKR